MSIKGPKRNLFSASVFKCMIQCMTCERTLLKCLPHLCFYKHLIRWVIFPLQTKISQGFIWSQWVVSMLNSVWNIVNFILHWEGEFLNTWYNIICAGIFYALAFSYKDKLESKKRQKRLAKEKNEERKNEEEKPWISINMWQILVLHYFWRS